MRPVELLKVAPVRLTKIKEETKTTTKEKNNKNNNM